jgi:hypothetical protein
MLSVVLLSGAVHTPQFLGFILHVHGIAHVINVKANTVQALAVDAEIASILNDHAFEFGRAKAKSDALAHFERARVFVQPGIVHPGIHRTILLPKG